MGQISLELQDGQLHITVQSDEPGALDTTAVETLIAELGKLRDLMNPAVPHDWIPGQEVAAVADPRWHTESEWSQGHPVLHIPDPRFGWLHYLIPKHEAKKLAELLLQQVDDPSHEPVPGKAN